MVTLVMTVKKEILTRYQILSALEDRSVRTADTAGSRIVAVMAGLRDLCVSRRFWNVKATLAKTMVSVWMRLIHTTVFVRKVCMLINTD